MASSPIISWQIDEETMEKVTDFIFLVSTWNLYNIVNQLYSKKFKKKITEEKTDLSGQVLMQMKVPYCGGFATKYIHW